MFENFKFCFGLRVFEWTSVDPGLSSIVWEGGCPTTKDSSTYQSSWIQRRLSERKFQDLSTATRCTGTPRNKESQKHWFPGLDSYPKYMAEFYLKYCLGLVKLNFVKMISHNFWLNLVHNSKYRWFGRFLLLENISVWHLTVAIFAHR